MTARKNQDDKTPKRAAPRPTTEPDAKRRRRIAESSVPVYQNGSEKQVQSTDSIDRKSSPELAAKRQRVDAELSIPVTRKQGKKAPTIIAQYPAVKPAVERREADVRSSVPVSNKKDTNQTPRVDSLNSISYSISVSTANSQPTDGELPQSPKYSEGKWKLQDDMYASEFTAVEKFLPLSTLGDLSNTVLPIFRPANFEKFDDYRVIEQSARLASLLLKHLSLQPILRTIVLHGKLNPLNETDKDGTRMYEYPRFSKPVTKPELDFIATALDDLAGLVTFKPHTKKVDGAFTYVHDEETNDPNRLRTRHLPGFRSTIQLPKSFMRRLTNATYNIDDESDTDIPLLLTLRFKLAVDLAHEVCHALAYARDGHLPEYSTDTFMPGALVAEPGFTMEEALFGGHPTVLWAEKSKHPFLGHDKAPGELSALIGMPVVFDWPSRYIVSDYVKCKLDIWVREGALAELPKKEIAWRVSLSDLSRFFSNTFWRRKNPPIRLERKVGFAFTCDGKGGPQSPVKLEANEVPEGYRLSKQQAIVINDDDACETVDKGKCVVFIK